MEVYSIKNPYPAEIMDVRHITKPGSAKETINVDISLGDSGLTYVTGDALGVLPNNDPALVDSLIAALGLDASEVVDAAGEQMTLREALITTYDITGLKKSTLAKWNASAGSAKLEAILADKEQLKDFVWGRDLLDLAQDEEMKPRFTSGAELVAVLPKLTARLYSIASSPAQVPGQVSLCVGCALQIA